ncbi:MAG: hypothetical protein M1556_01210 [Candidatus Thermoplasmatota archaeon]|jgi:hypothetical protein|nr:hypothetical protein [Candidatus Thermoplasmatota archaeon]MCL6002253.1 hypothetical protein [Candidatus Thermoplasmatota archaeon]
MISGDANVKNKEVVLLSQLSQAHVEKAVSQYPYKCFYSKNIRIQIQKMFDLIIDEDGDLIRIMGRRIGFALVAMEERGYIRARKMKGGHGIMYERES